MVALMWNMKTSAEDHRGRRENGMGEIREGDKPYDTLDPRGKKLRVGGRVGGEGMG